ncbi:TetR/AcrR family transcriptional regulator [Actinomadura rugatobispora]|uniref:TetR/AcrR family transcriptional regulator n=1 Tax=Actinomadura rugatobispora TaxID=1994 RepID=A0ABW1A4C9_9ACTN|nr:TetR/AcrR family transcriptional regulator [Actinomadura rugatobispora]
MSGTQRLITEPTRRRLTERQADTVRRLTDAAVEEVRGTGYDGLTVRNVARRAGVAPATAYTYFASKNHLITEVFWRRLSALPPVGAGGALRDRIVAVLRETVLLVSDEPELAAACTTAMLGTDPDVRELRERIGLAIRERLQTAIGDGPSEGEGSSEGEGEGGGIGDPAARSRMVHALEMAYTGALVHAGMGYLSYARVADRLAETVELILPDPQ